VYLSGIDYETGGRYIFETVVGAGMWRSVFSQLDSRIHVYGS
jgi:hypothetical protein